MTKRSPKQARKTLAILLTLLTCALLAAAPASAQLYSVPVAVVETAGSDFLYLPVVINVSIEWMIDQGFITRSDALDTRVESASGEYQEHSVADNKLLLFMPHLSADTQINRDFTAGNSALPYYNIIVGYNGSINVTDAAALEMGTSFNWTIRAFVDTRTGPDKNLIYKEDAFRLYVNAEGSIRAAILNAGGSENLTIDAAGLGATLYTVNVASNGSLYSMYVDGILEDSTSLGASTVPDNANMWYLAQGNSMPYIEYIKLEV